VKNKNAGMWQIDRPKMSKAPPASQALLRVLLLAAAAAALLAGLLWACRGRSIWGGTSERFEPPPGRVLIVMYSTPNILEYADLAARINEMYAKRHGYAFKHVVGEDGDTSMRPVWKKVFLVRDELPNWDAVYWIDSDAIVNDHSKPLPLGTADEFLISSDWPNGPSLVNTGSFIVKNTPFGRTFMERWAAMMTKIGSTYNTKFPYEQGACEDLIRSLGRESSKAKVLPAEALNSIFGKVSRGQFQGLFVIHLMACPAAYRKKVFRRWLEHNNVDVSAAPG